MEHRFSYKWLACCFSFLMVFACNDLYSGEDIELYDTQIEWQSLSKSFPIGLKSEYKCFKEVTYAADTLLRYHQSLAVYNDNFFCFNDRKVHFVFFEDKGDETWSMQRFFLFDMSHHNNAQFTNIFYDSNDIYPLLILSRGDYGSSDNSCFVLRLINENTFEFEEIGEISISIKEAKNNGTWVVDSENNKLYLYSLSKGDYRIQNDNNLLIFEFDLPDLKSIGHITLGVEDVKRKWEMPYLVPQGAVSHKGKILFATENVQLSFDGEKKKGEHIVLFNPGDGKYEAILSFEESMELEGISIYDNTIYLSFKRGLIFFENSIVLRLAECTIPKGLFE